jgi:hypothetical protein
MTRRALAMPAVADSARPLLNEEMPMTSSHPVPIRAFHRGAASTVPTRMVPLTG